MSRLADVLHTSLSPSPRRSKRPRHSHVDAVEHDVDLEEDELSDNGSFIPEQGLRDDDAQNRPSSEDHQQQSTRRHRRVNAPRKRSVTACNFCRVRKAKCDNTRPACGFCIRHGVACTYAGDNIDQKHLLDPASLDIINRLEEIKQMLSISIALPRDPPGLTTTPPVNVRPSDDATPATFGDVQTSTGDHQHNAVRTATCCFRTSCEAILQWPIFGDILPPGESWIESFLLDSSIDLDTGSAGAREQGQQGQVIRVGARRMQDEDHVRLCSRYLAHVHPRNPVLDEAELMACARETAEHGLGWDARSCLVLLACALALLTSPWEPTGDQVVEEDVEAAEAYFLAARKRFGLLQTSIMDMQCLFLAVTYEKCCLRPLRAWHCLEQACSRLQAHLSRKRRRILTSDRGDNATQLLEHRLFWSCVKAESEFMFEFPLRPTGIIDFPYPVTFPHPPEVRTDGCTPGTVDTDSSQDLMERSWFFYLAEISVRRVMIDTVEMLYHVTERQWNHDLPALVRKHDECQEKIAIWHAHLPTPVKFDYERKPDNELSSYLKARFQIWQIIVSRPLVYHIIHRRYEQRNSLVADHSDETLARARQLAQQCISNSASLIREPSYLHRHGGTWMGCRSTFAFSLLIMAAVLSGGELEPPSDWLHTIRKAHDILLRWGREASDVEWMRTTLVSLFNGVCAKQDLEVPSNFWGK